MAANEITKYLLKHLWREIPGLDVWRANRVDAMAVGAGGRMRKVEAGIDGQADLTGHYGPQNHRRCEIEVKGPGDSQNKNQIDFEHRCRTHGTLYIICSVKKKSTVAEIRTLLTIIKPPFPAHPAEIQNFINELKAGLRV